MKPYGVCPQDDNCCPGHAKYGQRGLTAKGIKRPRKKSKDKARKAKERQKTIDIDSNRCGDGHYPGLPFTI